MLREDRLEAEVVSLLENIEDKSGRVLATINEILKISSLLSVDSYRDKIEKSLRTQMKRMQRIEAALYEEKLAGEITKEEYDTRCREFADQIAAIQGRLNKVIEAQNLRHKTKKLSSNPILDVYLKSTPSKKRLILSKIFSRMSVASGAVIFEYAPGIEKGTLS